MGKLYPWARICSNSPADAWVAAAQHVGQDLASWGRCGFPLTNIYLIDDGQFFKIGKADDVERRRNSIQSGNPRPISVVSVRVAPPWVEKRLHSKLRDLRVHGEWFLRDEKVRGEFSSFPFEVPREDMVHLLRAAVHGRPVGWYRGSGRRHYRSIGCNAVEYFEADACLGDAPRCKACERIATNALRSRSFVIRQLVQHCSQVVAGGWCIEPPCLPYWVEATGFRKERIVQS